MINFEITKERIRNLDLMEVTLATGTLLFGDSSLDDNNGILSSTLSPVVNTTNQTGWMFSTEHF